MIALWRELQGSDPGSPLHWGFYAGTLALLDLTTREVHPQVVVQFDEGGVLVLVLCGNRCRCIKQRLSLEWHYDVVLANLRALQAHELRQLENRFEAQGRRADFEAVLESVR